MKFAMTAIMLLPMPIWAQFLSGSDGSDGALDYTGKCPGGIVVFNPASFTPPLNPKHDNIFNFTTITIPNGCTVRLGQDVLNGPVVWLAMGNVTINGMLDLNGKDGGSSLPTSNRILATPGAGGYPGGAGGNGTNPPRPGLGPGGGAVGQSGKYTGNPFAIPLMGGSGGGGGSSGGGGAGGGAILIASSTQIVLTPGSGLASDGRINATGGQGSGGGGAGSGGAVRLVAPTVSGSGVVSAYGGGNTCSVAGVVRIESLNSIDINTPCGATYGSPYATFASSSVPPTIKVVSVNGVPVASPAAASFTMPDVTINTGSPVTVQIAASQVPVGTIVNLLFFSDSGPDISVNSTPLAGTLGASTATATVMFPPGFTRGFVSASF